MAKAKKKAAAKKNTVAKKAAPKKAAPKKAKSKPAVKAKAKIKAKPPIKKSKPAPKVAAKKSAPVAKPAPKPVAKAVTKKSADIAAMFSPLDDRIIIEVGDQATRTAGGLYIPDTVEEHDRPKQGKVVAVGPGHYDRKGRLQPLDVRLGDTVLFESYMASTINLDGRDLILLRESQLLGIVKP